MFPFKARGNMVVVRYLTKSQEKVGAIVLPGSQEREVTEAEVVSVGRGFPNQPLDDIEVGDIALVRFREFYGTGSAERSRDRGIALRHGSTTYYIHGQQDIIGTLQRRPDAEN